jgi:hypothetical protein
MVQLQIPFISIAALLCFYYQVDLISSALFTLGMALIGYIFDKVLLPEHGLSNYSPLEAADDIDRDVRKLLHFD